MPTTWNGHIAIEHQNCERSHCYICKGGLFICSVCGGMEGSLLPTCPERWLTMEEDQANYTHYCNKTGPFAEESTK
jgi:hypothetical protein